MYLKYSKGQVLFDLWLTQILTEEKNFRPELLKSAAFKKFLLKLNPKITLGPSDRYTEDNLSLMFERMKKDMNDILQEDLHDLSSITFVPSLWLNTKTASTFLVCSITYQDKLFQTKNVMVHMQRLAQSRLNYLAALMDKRLEELPALNLDKCGIITYTPKSDGLIRACQVLQHSRVMYESIPVIVQRYWNATVGKFDNIKTMFQKVEAILSKMNTEPLCATRIFMKAREEKVEFQAWSQSREEQLMTVCQLRSVLTQTNRPPKFPVDEAFTDEEVVLFNELYAILHDFEELQDFLRVEKTLANVPNALFNFTQFCRQEILTKEHADVKRFLQALVDDLRAEAGRGFDFNNDVIKMSSILHPFFKGD